MNMNENRYHSMPMAHAAQSSGTRNFSVRPIPFILFYDPKPFIAAHPFIRVCSNCGQTMRPRALMLSEASVSATLPPQFRMQFPYPSFNFLIHIVEILRFSPHCRFV